MVCEIVVCGASGVSGVVVYREPLSATGKMGIVEDLVSNASIRVLNSSLIAFISSMICASDIALFAEANSSPGSS